MPIYEGKISSILPSDSGLQVTLTRDGHQPYTHTLTAGCAVTINGQPASPECLELGDQAYMSGQPCVSVRAYRARELTAGRSAYRLPADPFSHAGKPAGEQ